MEAPRQRGSLDKERLVTDASLSGNARTSHPTREHHILSLGYNYELQEVREYSIRTLLNRVPEDEYRRHLQTLEELVPASCESL